MSSYELQVSISITIFNNLFHEIVIKKCICSWCDGYIGSIKVVDNAQEYATVSSIFTKSWIKGICPKILRIYSICNPVLQSRWEAYKLTLGIYKESEQDFHGTPLSCDIMSQPLSLCKQPICGICGITSTGMDPNSISSDIKDFQRFGKGFYLAPHSSKCNDYAIQNSKGNKGMLLCDVLPGRKYKQTIDDRHLQGPPSGYHSVLGEEGERLNYPEIVVYNENAVMPRYIIIY